MALSRDATEFSMSLCATLAAKDVAEAVGCNTTDALAHLLLSNTGEMLFDDSLKLWWESPRNIAVAYLHETNSPVPSEWQ